MNILSSFHVFTGGEAVYSTSKQYAKSNPNAGAVFVKVIPKRVWTATILAVELQIADEIFSLYRNILEDEKPSVLEVSRSPFSLILVICAH